MQVKVKYKIQWLFRQIILKKLHFSLIHVAFDFSYVVDTCYAVTGCGASRLDILCRYYEFKAK